MAAFTASSDGAVPSSGAVASMAAISLGTPPGPASLADGVSSARARMNAAHPGIDRKVGIWLFLPVSALPWACQPFENAAGQILPSNYRLGGAREQLTLQETAGSSGPQAGIP